MSGMKGFYVSARVILEGHHGPLLFTCVIGSIVGYSLQKLSIELEWVRIFPEYTSKQLQMKNKILLE